MADTQVSAAQVAEKGLFGVEPASQERGRNLIKEFISQHIDGSANIGSLTIARDSELLIDLRITQIDHLVSLMDRSETGVELKIKKLLDLRQRLADLRGSLQGNHKLEEFLLEAVGNTEKLDKLKDEIKGAYNG